MKRRLAFLLLASLAARAGDPPANAPLRPDPRIRMGALENGMRFWIRPHATPPGKVELLLRFATGSLNEEENQRGLAHFLEHMAFNGSAHFPAGSLVPFFESIGLRFGRDQNAFTSFDQTVYLLTLPAASEETLKKGLLFFADVAHGLALDEEEVSKERGVILEEARSRKGADQRVIEAVLPNIAARAGARLPIGTEDVVASTRRDRLHAYWSKWYRPETTTLIACGDVDPARFETLVREAFAGWKGEGKPSEPADAGIVLRERNEAIVVTDPELTEARIGLSRPEWAPAVSTFGELRARFVEQLAHRVVNRRLATAVQEGRAPYEEATVDREPFLGTWSILSADASGDPRRWRESLSALVTELRRVHLHGIQEEELALARAALLSDAEQAAETEPTREASRIGRELLDRVGRGATPISAEDALAAARALLPGITAEEAARAFRAAHPLGKSLFVLCLPEAGTGEKVSPDEVLALFGKAAAAEVADVEKRAVSASPLEKDPAPGEVKARADDPTTGVTSVTLGNGIRVHLKPMDARKGSVFVRLTILGGAIEETEETLGLSGAAAVALEPGRAATARLKPPQVSDFLSGRKVTVEGGVGEQGFELRISGTPEDLEDGFRLAHALLTAPRVERASLDAWKAETKREIEALAENPQAQAALAVDRLLSGGDPRLLPPTPERIDRTSPERAQAWLERTLRENPIEASIVGDLPLDEALRLARTYLGSLPPRPRRSDAIEARRAVKQEKGPLRAEVRVPTVTPVAMVALGWRGAAMSDYADHVRLSLAAQILTARLHKRIREEKGLTYSVGCGAQPRRDHPAMGRVVALFTADPAKAEEALLEARAVMAGILESPPTDGEMATVGKQVESELKQMVLRPEYWSQSLADLEMRGQTLGNLGRIVEIYTTVGREDLLATVRRYFVPDRSFEAIAAPK
jgi:zinc protease